MGQQAGLQNETARLRKVVNSKGWMIALGVHARERMDLRNIHLPVVNYILTHGKVTFIEFKADELWHIEGKDVDGRSIRLVAAVNEDTLTIKIVTVEELRAGGIR